MDVPALRPGRSERTGDGGRSPLPVTVRAAARWVAPAAGVWLVAAAAFGGSLQIVVPPLVLAIVAVEAWAGWRWSVPVLLAGWLGVAVWRGFDPLQVYVALAMGLALLVLEGTVGAARRAARLAPEAERLVEASLSGLRGVIATRGAWDPKATLSGTARENLPAGLALWRTAFDGPELLAGGTGPAERSAVEPLVERAVATREELRAEIDTAAGARSVTAVPVPGSGDVGVVFTALGRGPLPPFEHAFLTSFAGVLASVLAILNEARAGRAALELVRGGRAAGGAGSMEGALLGLVLAETGTAGGAVLRYRAGRFVLVATAGELPAPLLAFLQRGVAFGRTALWTVRRTGRALFVADCSQGGEGVAELAALGAGSLALVPVGRGEEGDAAVVALFDPSPRPWPERLQVLLETLSVVMMAVTVQRDTQARLSELVRLQGELLATPVETMYQRTLEAALRMVPVAEAGSLLVRDDDGLFRYVAAVGYDLAGLADLRLDIGAMRIWYGEHDPGWQSGEPRVLVSSQERTVGDVSARTTPRERMRGAGRVDEIASDLCLPIKHRGEVLAVLNLDSMHDRRAFGEAAAQAASDLAPVIGFLLHETETRARLDRVARTDELTTLGNRRAFDEEIARWLARAARYGHAFCLLIMDLSSFKALNDTFGHAAGDDALRAVSEALRVSVRAGDAAFRWGGDEFAVLLPQAGLEEAKSLARRIADAVSALPVPGGPLRVNVGAASFPADGTDLHSLLACADQRMYRAKAEGRPWPRADAEG